MRPYKGVFFLDLDLCCCNQSGGSGISADFADYDEDIIYRKVHAAILQALLPIGSDFACNVY